MIRVASTHSWRNVPDPEHRYDEPSCPIVRGDDSWIGLRSLQNMTRRNDVTELEAYHKSFMDWRRNRATSSKQHRVKLAVGF